MEYRRKRRVSYRPGRGVSGSAVVVVCAVFLTIVYLISASRAGSWVAKNWIAPVLRRDDASLSATAVPDPQLTPEMVVIDQITREVVLPERLYYALQIGAYADESNAKAQADSLKKIGAAGYILQDGDRYRVLASAYAEQQSAEQVAAQLLNEGIESRIHTLARGEKVLGVTGTPDQIETVSQAAERVDETLAKLYEALIAFDKDKCTVADGVTALRPIVRQTEEILRMLADITAVQGTLSGVEAFYQTVLDRLNALIGMEEASIPVFSAALKELYIAAVLSAM